MTKHIFCQHAVCLCVPFSPMVQSVMRGVVVLVATNMAMVEGNVRESINNVACLGEHVVVRLAVG